jgi:hypothetical protein
MMVVMAVIMRPLRFRHEWQECQVSLISCHR